MMGVLMTRSGVEGGSTFQCLRCGKREPASIALTEFGGSCVGALDKYLLRHGKCEVAQPVPDMVASMCGANRTDDTAGS